jgi:DNA-binding CsgD family transcriptional regulator
VKIEGKEYSSKSAAAKALIASGKTLSEAAELCGITYQTCYAVTKGAEKVAVRRAKYRILGLGNTGKKSVGEIAKMAGVSPSRVVSLLKKANIAIVSAKVKEQLTKANKAPKSKKEPKVPENTQVNEVTSVQTAPEVVTA